MSQNILFVCTGNFYRSRFAEAVFNHHAARHDLPVRAMSRGLAIHLVESGEISHQTVRALREREIDLSHTGAVRVQIAETDLESADLVIALDRIEHFPMMKQQFPGWHDQITYWDVADQPITALQAALPEIERQVLNLVQQMREKYTLEAARMESAS